MSDSELTHCEPCSVGAAPLTGDALAPLMRELGGHWRVVADQKSMRFYGESATSPNIFWVDLKKLDFSESAHVRKLDLGVSREARGHNVLGDPTAHVGG